MANKNLLRILFVEDLPSDVELAVLEMRKEGLLFNHIRVDTRDEFLKALKEFKPDIIISDYMMPTYDGMQALKDALEYDSLLPFIIFTGSMNEETAVECLKAGATDYVIKEHMTRLPFAVKEALEQQRILIEKRTAELLLRENEEKLQSIFSAAPVGIGLIVNRVFMEVNDTFCSLTGYIRKELIGRSVEMIYATKREFESVGIDKFGQIAEKGIGGVETHFKCKDERIINVFLSSTPLDKSNLNKGVTFTAMDITERVQAEEALQKSQHLFQILAEVSPVGIFRTDPDGNTTYVNPKWIELSGLSYKEAIGNGWLKAVHPEDREKLSEAWLDNIRLKKESSAEYRFLKPDGTIIWVLGKAVPELIDIDGTGYIGTITDITERKKVEEILRSSEERLKILFEYAPDAYYLNDLKGNLIDGNIAAEKLLGIERKELIGKSFLKLKLMSADQIPKAAALLLKNLLGQSTGPDEFVLHRKDGSKVTVEIITHPVKIQGKTLVLGMARDITERKRTEEALRESEEKFRSTMENSADAIFITDQQGKYLYTNKAVTVMLGFSSEEMQRKTIIDLSPPDKRDEYFEIFKKVMTEGRVFTEIELLKKDGSFISTDLNSVLLPGGLIYGSCRDITERKHAEEELIKAKEKAEESDRLKTAFLHNISHEIRTPMNAIVGFSALLGETGIDKKTQIEYIENITKSSDHLLAIISDILEISNIEANITRITKQEVRLNSIFNTLYDQFLSKVREKRIALNFKAGLPDENSLIYTDPTRITQIITNLLTNAIKFTNEGEVNFGYSVKDKMIEFFVSDTGIGIPDEYHQRIFDRFYQVQNSVSRLYEGTGLGLAISKAYVEILGGEIRVSSLPGQGSTFSFTIPYDKPVKAIEQKKVVKEPHFAFTRPLKILVAEDVDSNYQLIHFFLSGLNTEVIRASDGKEAVDIARRNQNLDLILMDIKMPEMDGYTATKLIREFNPGIPIIAQTAYVDDKLRSIEAGCSGFITKPFDKKRLFHAIQELINKP